jgi:hypothetical protein
MKTAIEQMMEDLHDTFPRFFNVHSAEGRVFMGMATKYLSVEKEQIKNAWYDGYLYEGRMPDNECVADTYYKKTYGGKK